jgi:hypothetical protein
MRKLILFGGNKHVYELTEIFIVYVNSSVHGSDEYFICGDCDTFPSEFQPLAASVSTK